MKIASFNINNVRKRLPNLLAWVRRAKPDVVCLQELKTTDAEFPADAIRRAGYGSVWKGQKSWNGVATLARGTTPIVTRTELPGDRADDQSRYIEAAVSGVTSASSAEPSGNASRTEPLRPSCRFRFQFIYDAQQRMMHF